MKGIELEEMNIILKVPKEAVAVEVTASLLDGGKVQKAVRKLSVSDIRAARQAFLENVEDGDEYDAMYVLTGEGRRFCEELMKADDAARAANV